MNQSSFHNRDARHKQTFREGNLQKTLWTYKLSDPEKREELLKKLHISSKFNMRYRGLFQFYSDELVAYKEKVGSNKNANEFLKIFSSYLTDNFEDAQLSSWEDCLTPFWEVLLFAYFPFRMEVSKKQKQSIVFLSQLIKFVRWLDQRVGTSWYQTVEQYTLEALPELNFCEKLLNYLYSLKYPTIHKEKWNSKEEHAKYKEEIRNAKNLLDGVFQVKKVYDEFISVTDIHTLRDYEITGIPSQTIKPGILLHGGIGKKNDDDFLWTWYITEAVFPERANKFITFVG